METTFIEENCTINHGGRTFEAGGSWLLDCTDGHRRGVVYVKHPESDRPGGPWGEYRNRYPAGRGTVTTWHGETIAPAYFGSVYQGNFSRMRSVSFTVDGVTYAGRYCPDWSEAVKVRSTRKVQS